MDTFTIISFVVGVSGLGVGVAGMVLGIRANKRLDALSIKD
ncbi:hypothetical protein [Vibrio kyushuensis]